MDECAYFLQMDLKPNFITLMTNSDKFHLEIAAFGINGKCSICSSNC